MCQVVEIVDGGVVSGGGVKGDHRYSYVSENLDPEYLGVIIFMGNQHNKTQTIIITCTKQSYNITQH